MKSGSLYNKLRLLNNYKYKLKKVYRMAKYEPSHLKSMNTRIVYQEFKYNDQLFVNEIAKKTRISVPTVMKIVEFLIQKELIEEQEYTATKVGRKPNMLKLNTDKYFSIGIVYEGDYLILGIVDLLGNVLNFIQVRCGKQFEESLFVNIDKLLEMSMKDIDDLVGIGIGIPCIFDDKTREITAPLIGIDEPKYFGDTIDRISEKYRAKVIVDNDLNTQAFGEYAAEPLSKEDLIFISLGTGLGAGVILNGKVRKGSQNICGEIGYMMFEYSEEQPKSGWLEEQINLQAIKEKFGISDSDKDETKQVEAIEYVSRYLALTVNNLIFSYDVPNIVLDGYVIDLLGDRLIEETQKKIDRICYKPIQIKKRSKLFSGISGGGLLASNRWLAEVFR